MIFISSIKFVPKLMIYSLIAILCGGFGSPVGATSATMDTLRQILAARGAIEFGMNNRDALSMISAAKMFQDMKTITSRPAKRIAGTVTADDHSGSVPLSEVFQTSVKNILTRAEKFANGDDTLMTLITDLRENQNRGAGGLAFWETVEPSTKDILSIAYEAGKPSGLYLEGNANGNLTVHVTAPSGKVVCNASVPVNFTLCEWMAEEGGQYRITVNNMDDQVNTYMFLTN